MSSEAHILVIPLPYQGHINPAMQLSKLLASNGVRVTVLTTDSTISTSLKTETTNSINFESISDNPSGEIERSDRKTFLKTFQDSIERNLEKIVEKFGSSGFPVNAITYDSHLPWVLELSHKLGIKGAALFCEHCSVCAIYYHFEKGTLKLPLEEGKSVVELPCLPEMQDTDLPSFIYDQVSYPGVLEFILLRNLNYGKADWLLFNTFDDLEPEMVNWMKKRWPIKTIGPMIPSKYLDKKQVSNDKDYGLSIFSVTNENSYKKWLDSKEEDSVTYISFGSVAKLSDEQMHELALGLTNSQCNFLWVVREAEEFKLPLDFKARHHQEGRGMIVNWCTQLEVLAHRSVGCFITHCGWNSTLEALTLGVPVVAMPTLSDQPNNAKFIVDVWRVGVRAKAGENGIVGKEEVEKCVNEVLVGDKRVELIQNSLNWKKLVNEAVHGGSSEKDFQEFISEVICS